MTPENENSSLTYDADLSDSESDKRTKIMLDATPLACSLWDEDCNMIDCNKEALNLFGLAEKTEYLEHFYNLNPIYQPDGSLTSKKAPAMINAALETGYQRFEWLYLTSAGEPLPVETTLVRVPWSGAFRIAAYSRDLREEKANEQKVREAEERIRAMLDATPLACAFLDENSRAIDCNREAVRLFGVSSKDEYLDRYFDWMPEFQPDGKSSLEEKRRLIHEAFKTGHQHFEWMHLTASGELLPAEVTLVRVEWKGIYCIATYIRDLREIKANEQKAREAEERRRELQVQARAAQAASEAKSRFLASMSHEIRTPMNVIIGMSDLMRTDNLDKTQQSYFKDIKTMSYALLQIINDILDFSKIEAGKMDLIPVDYDIFSLYADICSVTTFTISGKSLEFKHAIDKSIPATLYGDEVRVRQIIMNIVNNAVKYTREGYVDLRLERVARDGWDYLSIRVEDSGIGIKKEDFPKLFAAFEQVDRKKNRGIVGTGLGLSITKRLVGMMGGEIDLQSDYGKGTRIVVLLPLAVGDARKVVRTDASTRAKISPDAKILVVDDNATNLAVANGLLSAYGMRVDTCESGREAIELVKTNDYDLVFMDHMMPDMDGTEATEILRETEEGRELPIIALTANAVSGMRELFMKSGMNDFLSKPIDLARLDSILHKWIPKNKQSGYEENFNSTKKSEKTSALETIALPKIAGVDTAEGVARVGGSISLYLGVLETYCRDAVSRTGFLRGFMDDKTDEKALMAFTTNVHALRSASANIGAIEVSRLSANLEGAARAADLAFIEENLSCFVDELEAIQARIRGAINEARSPAAGGGDGRDEVKRLVSALEAWDISAVDEILEGLPARGSSMDQNTREQLSEISELILMSEFEKALDAARALQHTLGI